ncbi:MAG: hypothetical protein N3A38_05525, partial [Planctomycetota bacterium]|nr:hypothetical protein [Planctomycetota bacterium]
LDGDGGTCDADIRINDLRKMRTVQDIGVASLEVETDGGPRTLIRYTPRAARSFSLIAGEIQRYLEEARKEAAKEGGEKGSGGHGG